MSEEFDARTVDLMRGPVERLADDPENALRFTLRGAGGYLAVVAQIRRRMGLTANEFEALMALWDGGRCTMSELTRRIGISRAAITTMTDRLEKRKLVQRAPGHDRRTINLLVTVGFERALFKAARTLDERVRQLAERDQWQEASAFNAELRRALRETAGLMDATFGHDEASSGGDDQAESAPVAQPQWW